MEFGLNLYSIRNKLKTEEEFLDTAIKLKEMGYAFMQFSGVPYDADMITRVSSASGMPIVLTHVSSDRIINDTEALMEEHSRFGCKNIGLGHMDPKIVIDEKLCKETIEKLNTAAEKMAANGFSFFYHNHQFEFYKYGNETVFDYMIKNAPSFNFTLDTYWLQYGGVSIIEYVEKLKGRIECVHLKDYLIEPKTDDNKLRLNPRFAPVGDGALNFKTIIPKMLEAETKYFIVEQDNAADFPDTLDQVKRSIDYLKKEF